MIPKFNYKIYDKKNKTFFSANRKSTWSNKAAVLDFIKKKIKPIVQSRYSYLTYDNYTLDDIDIHIFPIENAIIKSASDFLSENQTEMDAKEAKKLEKERKRQLANKEYTLKSLEAQLKSTQSAIDKLKK